VSAQAESSPTSTGRFAPLATPAFRRIWSASLLSNFGQLILGVAAAWEMTRLSGDPRMVALVQTALMLPLMLVAVPAGAIADMFDRRKIAMAGLGFSCLSGVTLSILAYFELTTPWMLLGFCSLIGAGVALFVPAWQASIGEQVPGRQVPAAIALGTVSYNLARSVGPALGGIIVLFAGAQAAFAVNALCYLPMLFAFLLWRRALAPARLPPERIDRAIVSGARYALHSSAIRTVLVRTFAFGLVGASAAALAPLIAKDLLGGDAAIFGLLLGASGVGAVGGALIVSDVRERIGTERAIRWLSLTSGITLAAVGLSTDLALTCVLLAYNGAANILVIALLNVTAQVTAPRWVTARALSLFSASLTGGIGIGAAVWGLLAARTDVSTAMYASGTGLALTALLGFVLRLPEASQEAAEPVAIGNEPEVGLALTLRSGPISVAIDYRVEPGDARAFYDAMRGVQRARLRNGGFNWSLARDIADPASWTERYSCPTWGDYLRMRDRFTQADREAQEAADAFHQGGAKAVRRRLERPFGSVRWQAESPDPQLEVTYIPH
jgi:MFS family permease